MAVFHDRAIVANNPNGMYDAKILCADCDGRIGAADKWFMENLEAFHSAAMNRELFEPVSLSLDARAAMQFAVSIIYRASLSHLDSFNGISLGPYTAKAGEIAVGSKHAELDLPFVMINVLTSDHVDVRQFAFYPVRCANGSGQYFIFTISGVQFLVKFGGQQLALDESKIYVDRLQLKPNMPVKAVCFPFNESAEFDFLRGVKRAPERRKWRES